MAKEGGELIQTRLTSGFSSKAVQFFSASRDAQLNTQLHRGTQV